MLTRRRKADPIDPEFALQIAHAAGRDEANRRMRKAGRRAWTMDDYNAACAECERVLIALGQGFVHE